MTVVVRGWCPKCERYFPFGASHYSDTGERVVPCSCGSRIPLIQGPKA